jgi:4a-hydroxytetrahydrobiopterin dehydratase
MTQTLSDLTCTPCRGGIPPLPLDAARRYLEQAPAWDLLDDGGQIQRTFRFANFRAALDFARGVGELAEAQRHHPDVAFGWGYVTVSLRTKKIKGLHENDFIMAVKIDRLARESGAQEDRPEHRRSSAAPAASGPRTSNQEDGSTPADH